MYTMHHFVRLSAGADGREGIMRLNEWMEKVAL